MDDLGFYVLSTVFQSYQDDGRVIVKGCVQWNPVYDVKNSTSGGARTCER